MGNIQFYLKEEVKNPIHALRVTAVWLVRFLGLLALRLVLWGFLFLLPAFAFLLVTFHWVTTKAKSEIEKQKPVQRIGAVYSSPASDGSLYGMRTLIRDIRFWMDEIERFRK